MVLETPIKTKPVVTWEPLPANFILPDDPVENIQQPPLAAGLTDALGAAGRIQPLMLMVSNMGIVATMNNNIVVKAPDWFYVPQVRPIAQGQIRRSYTPNNEGDPVAIVMEFLSDSDGGELSMRSTPPYGKMYFYEKILQVPTYITYDPYEVNIEVRYLQEGKYIIQSANEQGRVWVPELELYLGIWFGQRLGQTMNWLRWWDKLGNLLLWSSEQTQLERQKTELEHQRAEQEHQRAEQEHQRAELERQKAEQERQKAEQERQRAELERQKAEQERQRSEKLAAKLRELGMDPDL